jgi:glycosyltransferase involved in cell wall biosynthesis
MSAIELPLVSIVAACRNSAEYLPEMIQSVLGQDYPRLELFIQDGGSRDGTLEILQRYPVRWASEPDHGISQALNRAIEAARGEIIGFTCSDDKLQPGAVNAAVEAFQTHPGTVMVYGNCYMTTKDGRPYRLWRSRSFDLDHLFWECYIPFQTAYVRRQALLEVGGFDETMRVAQDYDLWMRLGGRYPAESLRYVPTALGSYHVRFSSEGWTNLREAANCHQRAIAGFFADPLAVARLKSGRKRALAGGLLMMAGLCALANDRRTAWQHYLRALRQYPALVFTKFGVGAFLYTIMGPRVWRLHKGLQQRSVIAEGR